MNAQVFPAIYARAIGGALLKTVDGRDLHRSLDVGRDFSTWIQAKLDKHGFVRDIDYVVVDGLSSPVSGSAVAEGVFPRSGENPGGRPRKEYHLTLDTAKEVAMLENNERGRAVRRYFIEAERQLREGSTTADELGPAARRTIGGIVKSVVPGLLAEALTLVLPDLLKAHLAADERAVAVGYKPALLILIERKVPTRKRRAFSQKVSARLRRFSADHGYATRISRESGRYLFQVEAINAWLVYEGERMIQDHMAALTGQGVLHLVRP